MLTNRGSSGDPGQYIIGRFKANSTEQSFTLTGWVGINAYQLRAISGEPVATATVVTGNGTSTVGELVTLTATVSATPTAPAGGTVQFFDNGSPTAIGSASVNLSGVATFGTADLTVGSHQITATFSGTTGFASSDSPAVTQTVLSKYGAWAVAKGLAPGNNGPNDDPDADAVPNFIEFAFNGNPKSAADNGMVHVLTEDVTARDFAGYGKVLVLTIAVRTGGTTWSTNIAEIDGITYTIEGGIALDDFSSDGSKVYACPTPVTTGLPAEPGTGYEWRSFILDISNGLGGKGFLRAKVVETSP